MKKIILSIAFFLKGALECYMGNKQICELAENRFQGKDLPDGGWTPEEVTNKAKKGDLIAIEIWDQNMVKDGILGVAIVQLHALQHQLNTDVVLTGTVMHRGNDYGNIIITTKFPHP